MYKYLQRIMVAACRFSLVHPWLVIALTVAISIPAYIEMQEIDVDTNLVRLLPGHSRAAQNTRELSALTGDGGYYTVMFSGSETNRLVRAADAAAAKIRTLPGVHAVEYQWPVDFFRKYRYLLVPNDYLADLYAKVVGWKSELSPAGDNLLADRKQTTNAGAQSTVEDDMEGNIRQFATLSRYHFSADDSTLGLIVRTTDGINRLQQVRELFGKLTNLAAGIGNEFKVDAGVAGSHRNKIDEFGLILDGLVVANIVSGILMVLSTIIGFRAIRETVVVFAPLVVGMIWGTAFVALVFGDLNIMTAFLGMILSGIGIDYATHLVYRIEQDLLEGKPFNEALLSTFSHSGPAVLVSGFATALSLGILSISDCKGFSEFGIISATVLGLMLLVTGLAMPAMLVIAHRFKFIMAKDHSHSKAPLLSRRMTIVSLAIVGVCLLLTLTSLKFDASFRNLQFDRSKVAGLEAARSQQDKVYTSSMSPGAIFIARDQKSLDRLLDVFDKRIRDGIHVTAEGKTNKTTIRFVRSLRDYAPLTGSVMWKERRENIRNIQEEMSEGSWIGKITNPDRKQWLTEMHEWNLAKNTRPAALAELPDMITSAYLSKDGSRQYLVSVFPSIDRKSANAAIAFTKEIYDLVPEGQAEREKLGLGGVLGPVGETPIFAELVTIVKSEIWWLVLLTFCGVFILVFFDLHSFRDTCIVMTPLVFGLIITFGVMALVGMHLNLFNVVIIPSLLGLGVDNGIHLFARWKETRGDVRRTNGELFIPVTLCTFTTLAGYVGMIFVEHPGLRSMGWIAVIGTAVLWVTGALMLPGQLALYGRKLGLLKEKVALPKHVIDYVEMTETHGRIVRAGLRVHQSVKHAFKIAHAKLSGKKKTPDGKAVSAVRAPAKKKTPPVRTAPAKKAAPKKSVAVKKSVPKKTVAAKKAAAKKKTP